MLVSKNIVFLLLTAVLFAGCLNNQSNSSNEQNNGSQNYSSQAQAGAKIFSASEIYSLALSPEEVKFDSSEYRELNNSADAFGRGVAAEEFGAFGYENGFEVTMLKIDGEKSSLKKLVQQASVYKTVDGARQAFAALKQAILQSEGALAELPARQLADEGFGVSATRTAQAGDGGGKNLTIIDFVLVFRKANVVEAIDFFGEEQGVSEKEALEIEEKAVAKIK